MRRTTLGSALALLLLGAAGCDAPAQPAEAAPDPVPAPVAEALGFSPLFEPFRVLTRNVYLGGDAGALLTLDFGDIPAVAAAASAFWDQVHANDFPDRARAIAREVALTDPHVVGLQEVALFVELAFDPGSGGFVPVGIQDMAAILMEALADRGLDYQLAVIQDNTSGVLPLSINPGAPGGPAPDRLLQFSLRDATLVRSDLELLEPAESGNYAARLPLGDPANPALVLKRGWNRVTVEHRGQPWHVVNTHLEVQGLAPVQLGQTDELIHQVTAGLDGVTVVMGDLNSDAEGEEGDPSWTPTYDLLMEAGFVDVWDRSRRNLGQGFTCCHDPDLRNATAHLDQRIDFVLVRNSLERPWRHALLGTTWTAVLGDRPWSKTEGGLWPSDHAGLFAGIRLPSGRLTAVAGG